MKCYHSGTSRRENQEWREKAVKDALRVLKQARKTLSRVDEILAASRGINGQEN